MKRIVERPGALDVHKASVTACVRVWKGRDLDERWKPTGVNWKPVWAVLEDGFELLLVNARAVKQVPGRKTDIQDAQWQEDPGAHGALVGRFADEHALIVGQILAHIDFVDEATDEYRPIPFQPLLRRPMIIEASPPALLEVAREPNVAVDIDHRPRSTGGVPLLARSRSPRVGDSSPRGSSASTLTGMRKVLVTGMSGTGKSSALAALERLGFQVVDTDDPGWTEWSDYDGGYVWREDRITELLSREDGPSLYVSGTVSNQGRFYPCFDAVVLLSAPVEVLLGRIANRTTNPYGKSSEQRELVLRDLAKAEPLLRKTCTHELDATQPLTSIVDELAELGRQPPT